MDKEAYRELVELARDRCRASAISVAQLLDDQHQVIALLINVAAHILAGAAVQIEGDPEIDEEMATYLAVYGIIESLGRAQVLAGKRKCAEKDVLQKRNKKTTT